MFNIFMCIIFTLMNDYYYIERELWDKALVSFGNRYQVISAVQNETGIDYELIDENNVGSIIFNHAKPVTPLKSFFLPVKENVTEERNNESPRIIIGIPNCDIAALGLLDELYLDNIFEDKFYRSRRQNTILVGTDCFEVNEHCHCTSYNIAPAVGTGADLSVSEKNEKIYIRIISEKGSDLVKSIEGAEPVTDRSSVSFISQRIKEAEDLLARTNKGLPDYDATGKLIELSGDEVWLKYSEKCVSCGACTAICPTCSCFLLIDKPGFHKVKQMDACQYPGFERVAGGEDALSELPVRFRNRYMCKYIWKPARFKNTACTGCGRCIEACIGKINKNELFRELAK